jgi:type I restriction-modification system DNA methylase subunit
MDRASIINTIGNEFLTINVESEFSYIKAGVSKSEIPQDSSGTQNFKLDIRFEDETTQTSVLVETNSTSKSQTNRALHIEKLLNSYCVLEAKIKPHNNIILILAESGISNEIKVWKKKCGSEIEALNDTKIKSMKEYIEYFTETSINNEIELRKSVSILNEKLHTAGIPELIRGQFVGTCLLALKAQNKDSASFNYNCSTSQIIAGIRSIISSLLTNNIDRADKLTLLDTRVLQDQHVRTLDTQRFQGILDFLKSNIIPHINQTTNKGQDLLNLFFTTFNKYVGKSDKNQAFTPDHITHFMCKIAELDKNTRVLDPTCGSGSFIVQALIQELCDCHTDNERNNVKNNNIYGIETEEKAYGLSTTNMLIHGDGNSNVRLDLKNGCFGLRDWIQQSNIDVVLMNPPYNAIPSKIPSTIKNRNGGITYQIHEDNKDWNTGKSDPTKGFCFVNYIADCVGKDENGTPRTGKKLLCLLPLSCAIGSDKIIQQEKHRILENNTLEAVFSLPAEMFYPGASVNACCMFFTLGKPHFTTQEDENGKKILKPREATFFGYYKDDGFIKRKGLGRVEKLDANNKPLWNNIEQTWRNLYKGIEQNECLGIRKYVTAEDEWLAEAYIKTDYSKLTADDFQRTLNDYFSYLIKEGNVLQKKDE